MATLPKATTTVDDTSGAVASGTDLICVWSPCATNADITPRQFGSAKAIYEQHGYCEGVEYAALHAKRTGRPILFMGLPIDTLGVISREDTSGNTGSCVTTVTAGVNGVLAEQDGEWRVKTGGTIGTDQIVLERSNDGGRNYKTIRLGTDNSYTDPYFGDTTAFAAGTLVAGDVIHTWHGSAPKSGASGWALARAALAAQQKGFRTLLLCGDLASDTEADAFVDEVDAYETANERFIKSRASVYDREPQAALSKITARMTGAPSLTFAEVGATGDTITRSAGSWVTDGFVAGDAITVSGSVSNNFANAKITGVTATVLTLDTQDLVAEGPVAGVTVTGSPGLTFAEVGATGDTITRNRGSWLTDGFRVGDTVTVAGSASNNVSGAVTGVTATVLTFGTTDLAAEFIGTAAVTITAGQTKAAWMAEIDAEFASIDDRKRVNLSAGRGRELSPLTGGFMRRPAAWAAALREFQHDLHIPTWRKDDGPIGFDLTDEDGNLAEWDDRVDGSAGVGARFTVFRTWANGPEGTFIAADLTRATDGSILSLDHNMAVVNLCCTTVQKNTENIIGRVLVLNDDGTATAGARATIETEINAALDLALLTDRGEGQRASKAVWSMSADDVLNVPDATVTGVVELNLNGTIYNVNTTVRVLSGGQ